MSDPEALSRIRLLFADVLHVEVPSPDTDLIAAGLLDSLGLVELLVQLEEAFAVEIPLDTLDVEDFRSLRSIAAFMLRSGPPPSPSLHQAPAGEGT